LCWLAEEEEDVEEEDEERRHSAPRVELSKFKLAMLLYLVNILLKSTGDEAF